MAPTLNLFAKLIVLPENQEFARKFPNLAKIMKISTILFIFNLILDFIAIGILAENRLIVAMIFLKICSSLIFVSVNIFTIVNGIRKFQGLEFAIWIQVAITVLLIQITALLSIFSTKTDEFDRKKAPEIAFFFLVYILSFVCQWIYVIFKIEMVHRVFKRILERGKKIVHSENLTLKLYDSE